MAIVATPNPKSLLPQPFQTLTKSPSRLPCSFLRPVKPLSCRPFKSLSSFSPAAAASYLGPALDFPDGERRKGCDVLVEALEREGVTQVFSDPDPASLEINQALTRSGTISNDKGGIFAAKGYASATGKVGVCFLSSGPDAIKLVSGLADAFRDSVPLVAITAQENPIDEFTKHDYLVLDASVIPGVVKEAFLLAHSSPPGPVLIQIPSRVHHQMVVPTWGPQIKLPKPPSETFSDQIVRQISESNRPLMYVDDGCLNSTEELGKSVGLTGIPVISGTLIALGTNYALHNTDIALQRMNKLLESSKLKLDFSPWRAELNKHKAKLPQNAIQVLDELMVLLSKLVGVQNCIFISWLAFFISVFWAVQSVTCKVPLEGRPKLIWGLIWEMVKIIRSLSA